MTGFLASVADTAEMEVVRRGGADIVDLKNPAEGALGAWGREALEDAVAVWRRWPEPKPMLSATIGDRPMTPDIVRSAAEAIAATDVPMIKLGVFGGGDPVGCFEALRPLAATRRLIAVFFSDRRPDVTLLDAVAAAGFHGAMLDTADKSAGGLRRHLGADAIERFVGRARSLGLLTGLAGSLRTDDVAPLAALRPDYLGFRGALCDGGRTGVLDVRAIERISQALQDRRDAA